MRLLVMITVLAATAQPKQAPPNAKREPWAPPVRVTPPGDLPGPARQVLRQLMAEHGRDMGDLIAAMMAVDYHAVAAAADRIRSDAFSRPLTGDATELNSLLPARFFDLQDQFLAHAKALSEAARRHDAAATSKEYAALSEACVSCHAVYREGRQPPRSAPPGH